MKYYIIAGEASGDLHGSNLIKEIKKLDGDAMIHCWGGDLMKEAGGHLIKHYKDLAFMGFLEVVQNLSTILNNIKFCKKDIAAFQPNILVLIDYPGFNLRIAQWAKAQGFRTVYYISPQVWAWKESRVKLIKKVVDKMLVILPFEKEFYQTKWNYKVEYIGHPLVQVINEFIENYKPKTNLQKPVVALLPGSRKQEVAIKLPLMLKAASSFPQYQFVVAKAISLDDNFYDELLKNHPNAAVVKNETYSLLMQSTAALVTSGTATLETALFNVPQVVCYKGSAISYQIAKRLIRIKYISLVNLIMDREVIKELIQDNLTVENLIRELDIILTNNDKIATIKKDYEDLRNLLNQDGNASQRAAKFIVDYAAATSSPIT